MESVGSPFVSFLVVLPLRREEREGGREGGRQSAIQSPATMQQRCALSVWHSLSTRNTAQVGVFVDAHIIAHLLEAENFEDCSHQTN